MSSSVASECSYDVSALTAVACLLSQEFGSGSLSPGQLKPNIIRDVITIAETNKLLKPVLRQLHRAGLPIPEDVRASINLYLRKALKNNGAALATLSEVSKALSNAGIAHAAFKGPVRQIALGQDVFERPVADVDILVSHSDFFPATDLLKGMGYWVPLFCDSPWWRRYLGEHPLIPNRRNRLGVDLHHRIQHPSCPRPRDEGIILKDVDRVEIGDTTVPIFSSTWIFLNTIMSIVKGLANREPTGSHVIDLARQLQACDDQRLAAFERAAIQQGLQKTYAVARRAAMIVTHVAPVPTPQWFIPDDDLLQMLLSPRDPRIRWPKHSLLLWKLVDGDTRVRRAFRFTRELAWWTAAELTRRTHDVSQLPAREETGAAAAAA